MGGETLHRADCGHIRRSNNTHPAPADRVRLLVSLGLTCSCVDRVEAVRQIRAERAAITGEPTPPTG
jgi:hypothetical protein